MYNDFIQLQETVCGTLFSLYYQCLLMHNKCNKLLSLMHKLQVQFIRIINFSIQCGTCTCTRDIKYLWVEHKFVIILFVVKWTAHATATFSLQSKASCSSNSWLSYVQDFIKSLHDPCFAKISQINLTSSWILQVPIQTCHGHLQQPL